MTDWMALLFPAWGQRKWFYDILLKQNPRPLLALAPGIAYYRVRQLDGSVSRWCASVLVVRPEQITLHPLTREMQEQEQVPLPALRWFGRPHKYHDGKNDIWLHVEQDERWQVYEIRTPRHYMHKFVRALKQIAHEDMVTAYRRMRPYVHLGPLAAHPAVQDIYGAWQLSDALQLYIMPLYLVILQDMRVLRVVPLHEISDITPLRRLDAPQADGLVRFRAAQETMSFVLEHYQRFAENLAQAARCALEVPPQRKQKSAEDDEEWD
ncbi:MAG: hypothetical protein HXY40_18295 [Chloroflexi bacterium]|nr:hypothetical protein [Chloroflexota bacterium]